MGELTHIEWANHTGGPFLGCSMVSPGCFHCYAMELAMTRLEPIFRMAFKAAGFADWETRPVWGDNATRVLTKGFWKDAIRLNRQAEKSGKRMRMFPSMIDWLDEMPAGVIDQDGKMLSPDRVLADFLSIIQQCKNLDWLLLTKRPEKWSARVHAAFRAGWDGDEWASKWLDGTAPDNVWVGTTVEDQVRANQRIPELIKIPSKVHFLSCEPLLGAVDLGCTCWLSDNTLPNNTCRKCEKPRHLGPDRVNWVIAGGESGKDARPMHPDWATSLRDQCAAVGVPFFFKQWGEWFPGSSDDGFLFDDRHGAPDVGDRRFAVHEFPQQKEYVEALGTKIDVVQEMGRIGKKAAGRILDGKEHNAFPEVRA